ncbi:MAG: TonB-dependent receptor [Chryseolinea sp.]
MKCRTICACLLLISCGFRETLAQEMPSVRDTAQVLDEIVVQGYLYNRPLSEVPASIAILREQDFERFSNTSLLPVVNTIPGVRMEERSPGSYRFSIRGSLLRSPFGVRNVKLYWNGLPLTDGGGNTYLNLIDFNAISAAEVIKGPGGSLYGAGTGGVVLLTKRVSTVPSLTFSAVGGSYGLQRYQIRGEGGTEKVKASIQYTRQQSDGYREQTRMRRDALNSDIIFATGSKSSLSMTLFYTDLFYETPGGLTKMQFNENPRQARPAKVSPPPQPGAVAANAAVSNKTGYAGVVYDYAWNSQWSSSTGVYGSLTAFKNPTIRNYESREESNAGARHETQYAFSQERWKGKITIGGEYQYFFSPVDVYDNVEGKSGNPQSSDELKSSQLLVFGQAELELPASFFLTVGASTNFLQYDYFSKLVVPQIMQSRNFDPVISPRIALLKKVTPSISIYTSISKGFSPPSLAEVRPSAGTYNNSLKPEQGSSFDIGIRGEIFARQLLFDITAYDFRLNETIVIQRTADGAEYFINAGKTSQRGLEGKLSWSRTMTAKVVSSIKLWTSYAYNHYRFSEYVQDDVDYSGNRLTGIAPTTLVYGVDLTAWKVYLNMTGSYTDAIPLNDANTDYAESYSLIGARVGYKDRLSTNFIFEVFGGIDNAFNETYSLGNDLNAIGGRYYNAAAGRNFFFGVKLNPRWP